MRSTTTDQSAYWQALFFGELGCVGLLETAVETEAVVCDNGFCCSMVTQFKKFRVNLEGLQFLKEKKEQKEEEKKKAVDMPSSAELLNFRPNPACHSVLYPSICTGGQIRLVLL